MGDTKKVIKRGRQKSMMEQQRFFSTVFNRICDMEASVSSSFFLFKIPYGISQNLGQMISFFKRKKGEEHRRGLGKMYWQQAIRQINMPATSIMNYGCSGNRIYLKSPSSSFFFFSYTFLTKGRVISAVIKDFRGVAKVNCILIFFQFFSLFNRQESPFGTGECLNGDSFFQRKRRKKGEDD